MKKWGGIAPKKALKGSGRAARAAKEGSSVFKAHAGGPAGQRRSAGKEARGDECLFNCAHKDWRGELRLSASGEFSRVPQQPDNGGRWVVSWSSDRKAELELRWSKWPAEVLCTADGGKVFRQPAYQFEMKPMAGGALPAWLRPAPAPACEPKKRSSQQQTRQPAPSSGKQIGFVPNKLFKAP